MPTVNGRLSFKLIGETRYPSDAEYANSADASHLYVAALQRRQLSDVLFEPFLGPLFGYSGHFEFVLCARARRAPTSPDSKLIGRIFLFHRRNFVATGAQDIFKSHIQYIRSLDPGANNSSLKQQYLSLSQELVGRCDLHMDIVLNRDGILRLSRLKWANKQLKRNTEEFADEISFDLEHNITDQIYFFIRDLTHQHQHHGNDADTIITTQRQSKPDDWNWALEIMYSLYFHIITVKRKEIPSEHVRALGILAYLQSYKSIVERRIENCGSTVKLPKFDDAASKESIKATKDYIDFKLNEQKRNSDNQKAFLLWFLATTFTVVNFTVGFADKSLEPHATVSLVANFLKTNAFILPLLALGALVYFISNLITRPRYDFKRDVVRLSITDRRFAIPIALVVGLALIAGGAYYFSRLFAGVIS